MKNQLWLQPKIIKKSIITLYFNLPKLILFNLLLLLSIVTVLLSGHGVIAFYNCSRKLASGEKVKVSSFFAEIAKNFKQGFYLTTINALLLIDAMSVAFLLINKLANLYWTIILSSTILICILFFTLYTLCFLQRGEKFMKSVVLSTIFASSHLSDTIVVFFLFIITGIVSSWLKLFGLFFYPVIAITILANYSIYFNISDETDDTDDFDFEKS